MCIQTMKRAVIVVPAFLAVFATAGPAFAAKTDKPAAQIQFGVDMARRGLWSEALFRFHQAETLDPRNPRVLNNLAVAYEATGEYDKALGYYKQALQVDPNNRELRANYGRFVEFYQAFQGKEGKDKKTGESQPGAPGSPAAPGAAAPMTPPVIGTPPGTVPQAPESAPEAPPRGLEPPPPGTVSPV